MDYMTRMENAFRDCEAKRQVLEDAAKDGLRSEFMQAFYADQMATLRTPGFADNFGGRPSMPFLQYVAEDVEPAQMIALVLICADAAKAGNTFAQKLIEDWAEDYAKYHFQEAAEE